MERATDRAEEFCGDTTPGDGGRAEALRLLAEVLKQVTAACDPAAAVTPEALTADQAAVLCGVSRSKWYDLDAAGQCPAPVEIGDSGGCRRWLRSELLAWLRAGAPSRVKWLAIREAVARRVG